MGLLSQPILEDSQCVQKQVRTFYGPKKWFRRINLADGIHAEAATHAR